MTFLHLLVAVTMAAVVDCCLESAMPEIFTLHSLPEPGLLLHMDRDGCFNCSLFPQDWSLRGTELFLPGTAGILRPHFLECWAVVLQSSGGPSAAGRCTHHRCAFATSPQASFPWLRAMSHLIGLLTMPASSAAALLT